MLEEIYQITSKLKQKKLARLRQIREDIRELDPEFQRDEDARLLAARKQMLKKRLADYEDRWERQDFAKKPIRRSPEDAESLKMRHQVSEATKRQRAAEDTVLLRVKHDSRPDRQTW